MVLGSTPSLLGSPHSDVLTASPSTIDAKVRLVEEIKSRGRSAVQHKSWMDADRLYQKGIEVLESVLDDDGPNEDRKKDLAVLHSNRSLALFQLNRLPESQASARTATDLDPNYVKGYWRLGQACAAMEDWDGAVEAYGGAVKADGGNGSGNGNKALTKELDKCRVKAEQERLLVVEGKFDGGSGGKAAAATVPPKPPSKPSASKPSSSSSSSKPSAPSTSNADKDNDAADADGEFTKSDHVRGYKIVGGKKTSYFHNELSDEARTLIGDIAPKKLDGGAAVPGGGGGAGGGGAGGHPAKIDLTKKAEEGTSAWNQAGTWEERDVTGWAVDTLHAALLGAEFSSGDGSATTVARVTKATKLALHDGGHASVAQVRGKKRYIYEFGYELEWELSRPNNSEEADCTGRMVLPDIDGTSGGGDGYDVSEFTVVGGMPTGKGREWVVRNVRDGGLRKAVEAKVDGWVDLFRATY